MSASGGSRGVEEIHVPLLAPGVSVGEGVEWGAHVVVHGDTVIGAECSIGDHTMLGRGPKLAPHSAAHGAVEPLELEAGVTVGANAVLLAGARDLRGRDRRRPELRARARRGSARGPSSGAAA